MLWNTTEIKLKVLKDIVNQQYKTLEDIYIQ